jgi:molecular chaperone HtpG
MTDFNYGANLLENLTTGLYQDSKVIYREYIQNACDQIDKAEEFGILRQRDPKSKHPDLGQGVVDIWLYPEERRIVIEDNATGITADDFIRIMSSIGDSDKELGKDKGFRGIGRLCGLAYCKKLIFSSRYKYENTVSVMTCAALKMREMIRETNAKIKRYSIDDVMKEMTVFLNSPAKSDDPEHFFRVELIGINQENEELFGGKADNNIEKLSNYLSFVAPVPYHANFYYRDEIYKYAKDNGVRIDEYNIKINGEPIFKKYKTRLKTRNGQDDVFGVECRGIRNDDGTLLAWLWFGKTTFKAAIQEEEISRGMRLRKENIQIGEDDTLRGFFSETRGNSYFVGEVFAVHKDLIPNSQRSFFNETPIRLEWEHKLRDYFYTVLRQIYYEGSEINASIKKITLYESSVTDFNKKQEQGAFVTDEERERKEKELAQLKKEADYAQKKLKKKEQSGGRSELAKQIIKRREDEFNSVLSSSSDTGSNSDIEAVTESDIEGTNPYKKKKTFWVDTAFPSASKRERKLLSDTLDKVFQIIEKSTDKKISDAIITKIKDELK